MQPTTTHKFLGLIVDQELRFKEHTNYVLAKGAKFISQYQWLARAAKGVSARFMRKFYLTVAVPRMLYAADMVLVPESSQGKGTKGKVTKLSRIQQQATLSIMGAM